MYIITLKPLTLLEVKHGNGCQKNQSTYQFLDLRKTFEKMLPNITLSACVQYAYRTLVLLRCYTEHEISAFFKNL